MKENKYFTPKWIFFPVEKYHFVHVKFYIKNEKKSVESFSQVFQVLQLN